MKKRSLCVILTFLAVLAIGCGMYVEDYYHADDTAVAAMAGTETVTVRQEENLTVFTPAEADTGFLFYPGGKVEAAAYAPLMLELAQSGILCVLVEMPFHLAVLDMDAAEGIPARFPEVERWYIGGHSLGGSMAASFLADNAADYAGLVLLAAYSTADLTGTDLKVLSLYGSEDGVLNREKYQKYRENLPESTQETILNGGNHAGFGSYGPQDGDGASLLPDSAQIELTVEAMVDFLEAQKKERGKMFRFFA